MLAPGRHPSPRLPVYALCVLFVAVVACGKDTAGPGPAVVFITQPSTAIAGAVIAPPVVVMVRAGFARPLGGTVTLALDPNPCGWELAGTLTAEVIDSTARFADLALDMVGRGYTLRASARGGNATSDPFDVYSGVVTGPVVLENVLCSKPNPQGDAESLTYVPEDEAFWIADDNSQSIFEIDRRTGDYRSQVTLESILEALPAARQCDDGDGDPNTVCSYVSQFELLTYDPVGRSMYVVNAVDGSPDRPAIFRLAKGACAGCFTPESWRPLPVEPSYSSIVVVAGQIYLALGGRLYAYDYDTSQLATVDANGDSLPPAYTVSSPAVDLSFDGTYMWILTNSRVLYQVEWITHSIRRRYELDAFDMSLPRGMAVVGDTIYILEGDDSNPIYVLSQRQP